MKLLNPLLTKCLFPVHIALVLSPRPKAELFGSCRADFSSGLPLLTGGQKDERTIRRISWSGATGGLLPLNKHL